jgi:hypothetical protein
MPAAINWGQYADAPVNVQAAQFTLNPRDGLSTLANESK